MSICESSNEWQVEQLNNSSLDNKQQPHAAAPTVAT